MKGEKVFRSRDTPDCEKKETRDVARMEGEKTRYADRNDLTSYGVITSAVGIIPQKMHESRGKRETSGGAGFHYKVEKSVNLMKTLGGRERIVQEIAS